MNTEDIIKNSKAITLADAPKAKGEFCALWPNVKSGLTVLQSILNNPIAKAAIGIVIAAGDAVTKEICN